MAASLGAPRVLIIGGTGRIGSAVASHLLAIADEPIDIVLAGRDAARGAAAVAEVRGEVEGSVCYEALDWRDSTALDASLAGASAVVHTAGPYAGETPDVLAAAIRQQVPVYVDLSDPVDYLDAAAQLDGAAREAGVLALCAAGAFPGLSNVLAMECAARLGGRPIRDVDFAYFTAGLGGSGEINLYITNEGFGDPVPVFRGGRYRPQLDAGGGARTVPFFTRRRGPSFSLIGERTVWNWPFPEGCTVARQLAISGDSSVGMGTSPELWNTIMGAMVAAVPRPLWKEPRFSRGLAAFSKPLVAITDRFVGETHAMRVDVTAEDGSRCTAVQSHRSFRRVVGQSCATFTASLLRSRGLIGADREGRTSEALAPAGVFLPEARFEPAGARAAVLDQLLSVEGTLDYDFEVELASDSERMGAATNAASS